MPNINVGHDSSNSSLMAGIGSRFSRNHRMT